MLKGPKLPLPPEPPVLPQALCGQLLPAAGGQEAARDAMHNTRWCTSSAGHQRRIKKLKPFAVEGSILLSHRIFLLVAMQGQKNPRFVKAIQRFDYSKPTGFSERKSFLKLPNCHGYELQKPQKAAGLVWAKAATALHNPFSSFSRATSTSASSQRLFQEAY